jgi:hypothetical protein
MGYYPLTISKLGAQATPLISAEKAPLANAVHADP